MRRRRTLGIFLLFLFVRPETRIRGATLPQPLYELIAPGVAAARVQSKRRRLVFHVVKVDLRQKGLWISPIKAAGKETLAQMAQRLLSAKVPLVAAVNGDYFDRQTANGTPWGIHLEEEEIFFSPTGKSAFLIDRQGKPLIDVPKLKLGVRFGSTGKYQKVAAVNRRRKRGRNVFSHSFCLYTPRWGSSVAPPAGGVGIVVKGGPVKLRAVVRGTIEDLTLGGIDVGIPPDGFLLTYDDRGASLIRRVRVGAAVSLRAELVPGARSAIGGGPRILRAGKVSVEFNKENFQPSHVQYLSGTHPRAAVGYNRSRNVVILCVVEGRSKESVGVTMSGLGRLMAALGAWDAMAFDGGGSATMYVAGTLAVRGRSGGGAVEERRLANALGIFYGKKPAR